MSQRSKYDMRTVFDEALSLFEQKNTDYGDSWRKHGWRGNLGRILEKADRLQNTLWHSGPVGFAVAEENARQTALDMMNTLAFFIINHDQRREWGHEPTQTEVLPVVGAVLLEGSGQPAVIVRDSGQPQRTDDPGSWDTSQPNPFDETAKPTPRKRAVRDNPQA